LEGSFDAYSIEPGTNITGTIARGLEECDVYVPLLSPVAVASEWCELEISQAIHLSLQPERNGRPRIIAVVVKQCKLPSLLRGTLGFNFEGRYADALKQLVVQGFGVPLGQAVPPVAAPALPEAATLPHSITDAKDGKEMILIPAGEFVVGEGNAAHRVYLDAFYIDRYPVTNVEYRNFVDAMKYTPPIHWIHGIIPRGRESHPVVNVSWNDAMAYAQWVGGRLPTEAEWEKAASWDEVNKTKRVYPWGDEFDVRKCNTSESRIGVTTPVGKYSPKGDSPYGVADMAGNVWEWCADWYSENYYVNSPARNPRGPTIGKFRVLRGGSWNFTSGDARCTSRLKHYQRFCYNFAGFRIARSAPEVGSVS
jgi:sulfatase modifying factor 1